MYGTKWVIHSDINGTSIMRCMVRIMCEVCKNNVHAEKFVLLKEKPYVLGARTDF